jgi:OOP family OmpA-OmpF porin
MNGRRPLNPILITLVLLATVGLSSAPVWAQTNHLEGVIKARDGMKITMDAANAEVVVLLTDSTDVGQNVGALRSKRMPSSSLIPGLPIQVDGEYNSDKEFVAKKVRFKGNDLQQAKAIHAGVSETKKQAQQNQQELEKQNAELKAQNEALQAQQSQIEANKAAIAANSARFGQLNDWYIIDEVTIYFANGKASVDPKYVSQLGALAEKSKSVKGHKIEVKGFASAVGSKAANQKLSEQRARAVTQILLQDCHVPLTSMITPAAMGESRQVGDEVNTPQGEAQNRRVRVRILQNKGVAGS